MHKKGQFYLIAALVIISLLAGATAVYNIATAPDRQTFFYSLQEEASYEAGQVVTHGLKNSIPSEEINNRVELLANHYSKENPDTDLLIIEGNQNQLTFKLYKNVAQGNLGINYGDTIIFPQNAEVGELTKEDVTRNGDTITAIMENGQITREFKIRGNENYYLFIIRENSRGELFLQPKQTPLERILSG